ncbi:hypothetical protein TNCV_3831361 [Trichonephila clavipes]|nr:hypothetical protein TNCV_3831361 [Trichonephila clavipes]
MSPYPLSFPDHQTFSTVGKASQRRTLSENVKGRVIASRCWAQVRFGVEIKRTGRLLTRTNGVEVRSEESGANVWHPPMRSDEGRESDLPMEFKGVDLEVERDSRSP